MSVKTKVMKMFPPGSQVSERGAFIWVAPPKGYVFITDSHLLRFNDWQHALWLIQDISCKPCDIPDCIICYEAFE